MPARWRSNQFVGNVDVSRAVPRRRARRARSTSRSAPRSGASSTRSRAGEPDSYRDGGVPNQRRPRGDRRAGVSGVPSDQRSRRVARAASPATWTSKATCSTWLRLGVAGRTEHYSDFGNTRRRQADGARAAGPPLRRCAASSAAASARRRSASHSSRRPRPTSSSPGPGPGAVRVADAAGRLARRAGPRRAAAEAGELHARQRRRGDQRRSTAFDITVDYYHIEIDDRIVLSGNFTAPLITALLAPFGANSARFFTNAIDTRTNGVDVTASYRVALDGRGRRAAARRLQQHAHEDRRHDRHAAAARRLRAVLFDRIERRRHRVRPAAGQRAARRRLAPQRAGASNVDRRALRRVLQLHRCGRPTIRSTRRSG